MASTYTDAGIELIAVGEQSNTWGLTTNTNWRLMEEMVAGVVSINLTGLTSSNLTVTDGATSNGRHMVVEFTGSPGATSTVTVNPDDMQKLYFINNATDQSVVLTQGSGGDVTVPAGTKKIVYCDGAGGGAAVTDLTENLAFFGALDLTSLSLNGTEITATASELNTLDGITASTSELNTLDGVTASTAELNVLDGVTASASEINYLDGATPGTLTANKTVVASATGAIALGSTWSVREDAGVLYFNSASGDVISVDADGTLTTSGEIVVE